MNKTRQDLLAIYQAGLDAVAGKAVVSEEIKKISYPKKFHVIAIGKASDAMLQGIPKERIISALLISKHGHVSTKLHSEAHIQCLESDHPIPKESSLKAGQELINYLKELPDNDPCVFLISGGTSALVEVLEDDWSLLELSELTNYLLANAYPIDQINAVRKQLSKIKGGSLWNYMGDRPVSCLMISDVPNDKPTDIGSGLLFSKINNSSLLSDMVDLSKIPAKWVNKLSPEKKYVTPADFQWKIIASLSKAKQACASRAKELGYEVKEVPDFLEGEASRVAKNCVLQMQKEPNILFIWGGETTVHLPKNPGKGGRNQHLALAGAIALKNSQDAYLLVAGTDGTDGMTTATGALIDGDTVEVGEQLGLDAKNYLAQADSNTFFTQTKELIITGATGTNVMDLVLGIYSPKKI